MGSTALADPLGRDLVNDRKRQEERAALNALVAASWGDPQFRRMMAAVIAESVYLGFEHTNLLNLMTVVERRGFNDRVTISEVKGLTAHWLARGGYIEVSTLQRDTIDLPRDTIGFHVMEFEDKLETDFAETQETLIRLGIERLDAEVNLGFLRLLQAAVPSTSPYYYATSGFNLNIVRGMLTEVRDESRMFEVAIVGRGTMLDQLRNAIQDDNSFTPQTNEEILRRGVLGSWLGANLVQIMNFRDDMDVPFFPANELWIVARDASRFAFWGELKTKEFSELDDWYWHYLARRDFGGIVHRPHRVRRIVDNDTPAYTIVEQ